MDGRGDTPCSKESEHLVCQFGVFEAVAADKFCDNVFSIFSFATFEFFFAVCHEIQTVAF